jgi:hypothetical protein
MGNLFPACSNLKDLQTRISDPSPLDLCERAEDSVYVEAINP